MAKPGALIPAAGREVAITTTEDEVSGNSAFRIAVTTAGSLKARYASSPDNEVTLHYPLAGVYFEPGEFLSVWLPVGGTIVTVPANTIVLLA